MQSGTSLKQNDRALIIIGDPGSRKTTLCLNFPKPYFLDCDGNLSAPVAYTGITSFKYDRATQGDDGIKIHPLLRYLHCVKCLNVASQDPDIDTIIIDSLTSFIDIIFSEVKRQEYGIAAATDAARDIADNKVFCQRDWGKFLYLVKHVVTTMRTCGKTFVVTAHNNFEKDEVDGRYKQFINIPGQSKSTISGLFTDCWNTKLVIAGVGDATTAKPMVYCMPVSDTDHRGVKSSFPTMKRANTWDETIAAIKTLSK